MNKIHIFHITEKMDIGCSGSEYYRASLCICEERELPVVYLDERGKTAEEAHSNLMNKLVKEVEKKLSSRQEAMKQVQRVEEKVKKDISLIENWIKNHDGTYTQEEVIYG